VVDEIDARGLIGRVAERGPALREELEAALTGNEIVREVRGRGFLLGIDLVDPGDGESILPDELRAHEIVDDAALRHGVMVTSTHSNPDGYAGDQTTIAPAYVAGDEELAMLVERVAAALMDAEREIKQALAETTPNRSG
jgi:adenosylmethionine-8-amino-7-oxononanoate aminotransferase